MQNIINGKCFLNMSLIHSNYDLVQVVFIQSVIYSNYLYKKFFFKSKCDLLKS